MLRLLLFLFLLACATSANAGEPVFSILKVTISTLSIRSLSRPVPPLKKLSSHSVRATFPAKTNRDHTLSASPGIDQIGCIDVPIPMELLTREMTYTACAQHGGWQAAMEFLH